MRFRTLIAVLALAGLAHTASAQGGGVRVLCSNGMKAVFDALRPQIERERRNKGSKPHDRPLQYASAVS